MKSINEDRLARENWDKVYAGMPGCMETAMHEAFGRIHAHRRQRRVWQYAAACAACVLLVLGIAGWTVKPGQRAMDRVMAPPVEMPAATQAPAPEEELPMLTPQSIVYASKVDAYFHIQAECAQSADNNVELQLITAREFAKLPCSACGADQVYDEAIFHADMENVLS